MPGSQFELHCPGCSAGFRITTGAAVRPGEAPGSPTIHFHYEQMTCRQCQTLFSMMITNGVPEEETCSGCGSAYEQWDGFAGMREDPAGRYGYIEVVEGPCPHCGTALEVQPTLIWD